MTISPKISEKLRELPDTPGCYIMRDKLGRIIYVGKAVSLRKRVQSYFRQGTLRSASPKLRGMLKSVADLDILVTRSEAEAILTEGRLIKDYRPRYNVSFRDDKRFLLLRVTLVDPLPRFELCRIQRDSATTYFGPYASSASARATLDYIEKTFGLRKCKPAEPGEDDFKHCINDIVRFCSAPCVGRISAVDYRERVEEACAFLRGERPEHLRDLRAAMIEAGATFNYERAAALRDTLLFLQRSVQQRARMTSSSRELAPDQAKRGVRELQSALHLPHEPLRIECYDISNISGTHAVASMVCSIHGLPARKHYKRFRIKTVEGIDDPRMIAEVIARRFGRLRDEGGAWPDLVLIDGGITQLRAARAELERLDLPHVNAAGLAKRFEEIYWEDGAPPLRLPKDSPGLMILQRIRDEAHRFALTYHRHLRSRRIRESILDDIPGIGTKRKHQILNHFGSIQRLSKAAPEAIAEIPGIGQAMAAIIHSALHR
ncbi:MAG: excinuclease ABC subunit UvrC [Verrucomicrobia bacterium]|nr:excinuclease ABC subunit UvrC [Verrucomicrobiota bacterium]MDA1087454.1 excinuclease ABC subunit UvrC [Verrucomicrobiota bacterium]